MARPLDHVVVAVPGLDDTADALQEAGFVVTPRSDHPFGTSNRLVMLPDCYVELVTVTDHDAMGEAFFPRFVADALSAGRHGPIMAVIRTDDSAAERRRLLAAGMTVPPPLRFGRTATLPDGSTAEVEFESVFPELDSATFSAFLCRHLTPELVWHPDTLRHPNGADGLVRIETPHVDATAAGELGVVAGADGALPMTLGTTVLRAGPEPTLVFSGRRRVSVRVGGTAIEVTEA